MKIQTQWLQFIAFLTTWQITLLSLTLPFIIFFLYYFFIVTDHQQEITQQQTEITQRLTRMNHYQSLLDAMPSLDSLMTLQTEYDIPLDNQSPQERLQSLLIAYHFIPETWENTADSLYKLTFILSYSRFLTLLEQLNQAGFFLVSLSVIPTNIALLSIKISLTRLNDLVSEQGDIS
ncbi:hypothetical protein [Proteus sp. FME41]|uniref:hypothetical protein n=1 Tax=Proteus sp. FME41 TaxID=2742608 RepID=UPI001868B632|nr:hypothetical protein [Proteus sp. FME41]